MAKLTVSEFAERYRMSTEKVYRLIANGDLRATNTSTGTQRARYVIDEADAGEFDRRRGTCPMPDVTPGRPTGGGKEYV